MQIYVDAQINCHLKSIKVWERGKEVNKADKGVRYTPLIHSGQPMRFQNLAHEV